MPELLLDLKGELSPSAQPILVIQSQWTSIMVGDFSVVLVRFLPRLPFERLRFDLSPSNFPVEKPESDAAGCDWRI